MKLIIYKGNQEVLVTTPESENKFLEVYFTNGGRNLEDYDREIALGSGVCLTSSIKVG